MKGKLRQTWEAVNTVLTRTNLVIVMIIFMAGFPKKFEDKKLPLAANIVLLALLILILIRFIVSYSTSPERPGAFL